MKVMTGAVARPIAMARGIGETFGRPELINFNFNSIIRPAVLSPFRILLTGERVEISGSMNTSFIWLVVEPKRQTFYKCALLDVEYTEEQNPLSFIREFHCSVPPLKLVIR
jgi:hypothetical protein